MNTAGGKRLRHLMAPLLFGAMAANGILSLAHADDYVGGVVPSPAAQANFAAIPENLPSKTIVAKTAQDYGLDEAYYTEEGEVSIPPGAMVEFSLSGKCMDPHLPAPANGEPMQFVDVGRLVPAPLRRMYENLMVRKSRNDPKVLQNNPQHLVWAIRMAGTDHPLPNSLSDAQLEVLDECAGRRGAFSRYHEKMKKRNAQHNRRKPDANANHMTVGNFSYDASELPGTNGMRIVETHISTLTEMGENSESRTSADFRYGEIDDEIYSDIVGEGGLSLKARILNASEHRWNFRALDFAAQVGNGSDGSERRQRVTMEPPAEFVVVLGAAQEGVEVCRETTELEEESQQTYRVHGRNYRRHSERSAEGHVRSATETGSHRWTRRDERTTVVEIQPVSPVPSVSPVSPVDPVTIVKTNTIERIVDVPEGLAMHVVSLEFDPASERGTLVVEITSGSFREATRYIREHIGELVQEGVSSGKTVKELPPGMDCEVEAIAIDEDNLCRITFLRRCRLP